MRLFQFLPVTQYQRRHTCPQCWGAGMVWLWAHDSNCTNPNTYRYGPCPQCEGKGYCVADTQIGTWQGRVTP